MKPQTLLLVLSSFALVACEGQRYHVHAGPMFARARGEVALQNAGGSLILGNNQNSIDGDLGVGDEEVSPYLRASTDIDRHRVRADGFWLDAEGNGTLGGDYGGLAAGSLVSTTLDFYAVGLSYAYQLVREEHFRFAGGAKVGFYSLDVTARSAVGQEEVVTEVFVPMPYIEAEAFFGPVTLGANAAIMAADLGDADGRYWDLEGYASWRIGDDFDVKAGYRYLLLDGAGRASSRDFDADVDVQGVFVSAGVRF